MDGMVKISTLAVTKKVLLFVYLRLKMETAQADLLTHNGYLSATLGFISTTTLSFSIFLPSVYSGSVLREGANTVIQNGALYLEMIELVSYVQMNHLMAIKSVDHMHFSLATKLIFNLVRTCLLTRKMETSQSMNWKYGKLSKAIFLFEYFYT